MSPNTMSKCSLNTTRVGDSTTSLDSPFQCLTIPFREVVFPNVQPEPSLVQLEAIPSSPITSHTRLVTHVQAFQNLKGTYK